ncbi:MAG: DUF4347 domain-containing protein, partial [Opitutae bacterium]|nr:DUF4347 domain-containing protein [Opitutae bacterium]
MKTKKQVSIRTTKHSNGSSKARLARPSPQPLALEPRLMFDGDAAKGTADILLDPNALLARTDGPVMGPAAPTETDRSAVLKPSDLTVTGAMPMGPATPTEIVFVDTSVADWQVLTAQLKPGLQVVLIDPSRDGFAQVRDALAGRIGLTAIHIVSHGAEGTLMLGATHYTADNVGDYSTALAAIGQSLTPDGDVLLYGCDIARSDAGAQLLGRLASATQADVAASTDTTGTALVGGNWSLERATGKIESNLFLTDTGVLAYRDWLSDISLTGKSGWTAVMFGASQDPHGDTQAGAADTDIVGDASHGSLYVAYNSNGTSTTSDDMLAFRLRIDNPTGATTFNGVAVIGLDVNLDGRIDIFVSIDGRNNGQVVRLLDPGTGANISPNTTSTAPLPTGWLANNGVYALNSSNYSVVAVAPETDPHWTGSNDLGGDGKSDLFVSWAVPMADLAAVLAKPSPADRNGVYGPRGATGITGFTKDTTVRYVSFTQTQSGPINGDLNGVGSSYDKNATFSSLGAYTAPMSTSNPVSASNSVRITGPISTDGYVSNSESGSVTISGTSLGNAGRTLTLTVSDGVIAHNVTGTVTIEDDGTWSVTGLNLTGLNQGSLTVSASATDTAGITANDSTTVILDRTAPVIGIDALATSGKPTINGTSDLPAGSTLTVSIDPNGDGVLSDVVTYAVVVGAGGAWSVNLNLATPASGSLPVAGLTSYAKITATGSDAAGNSTTATAIDLPTVTSMSSQSTTPTVSGSWYNVAGDKLYVVVNGVAYGTTAGVSVTIDSVTYTTVSGLNISGNTWSVALTSNTGGNALSAGSGTQSYNVVAAVDRNGTIVKDGTSGELTIVSSPAVDIGKDGQGTAGTATSSRPTISGSATANAVVVLRIDLGGGTYVYYSATADGSGDWSVNLSSATPVSGVLPTAGLSGTVNLLATVTDSNNRTATDTQALTITSPTVTITKITGAYNDGTGLTADGYLNSSESSSVVISGTSNATAGSTINVTISDGRSATTDVTTSATVQSDGSWTATAANLSTLQDGSLTFTAVNGSASHTLTEHKDSAAFITFTSVNDVKKSNPVFTGVTDLAVGSQITVTGGGILTQSGGVVVAGTNGGPNTWSVSVVTPNNLSTGSNITFTASGGTGKDVYGNSAANATQVATVSASGSTGLTIAITNITGAMSSNSGDAAVLKDGIITFSEGSSGIVISGTTSATAASQIVLTITDSANTTITINSSSSVPLTVVSGASWTASLTAVQLATLKNGPLKVTATATTSGVSSIAEARPTLDWSDASPTIAITTPVGDGNLSASEAGTVTISGTTANATVGATVTVTVTDGSTTKTATTTVGTGGAWSATFDSAHSNALSGLSDGTLNVTAATSGATNATATVLLDKVAPALTVTALATAGRPTIQGTTDLPAGSTISVTIDPDNVSGATAAVTYTATVLTGGAWSIDLTAATPTSGSLPSTGLTAYAKITATATDAAGNSTTVNALDKPVVNAQTTNSTTPTITGTWANISGDNLYVVVNGVVYGTSAGVSVTLNGSNYTTVTGLTVSGDSWSLTTQSLSSGSYNVDAYAYRSSSNQVVDASTGELNIDATAPAVAITGITSDTGTAGDYRTKDQTLIFSGTAETNANVLLVLKDASNNTIFSTTVVAAGGTWSLDRTGQTALETGTYTLTATATDSAGNSATVSQSIVIDLTGPAISITSNSKTPDTTPVISGTTDLPAGSTITLVVDPDTSSGSTTHTYTVIVQSDGTWSVDTGNPTVSGVSSGPSVTYTNGNTLGVTASGTDNAGNYADTTKNIEIGAAPTIAVTRPTLGGDYTANATEDDSVVIQGTSANTTVGDTVTITITDGTHSITDTTTVQSDRSWSIAALNLSSFNDGTITITASYTDSNGNTYSDTTTVQHDKTAPTPALSASSTNITGPVTVTITFAESVSGLALSDFGTSNGASVSNLSGSGSSYTVTLTPAVNGTASLWLPAGAVADTAGNNSSASNILSFSVSGMSADNVAPTVVSIVRQSPTATITNEDSVTFRVTFSEAVQNVDASDFTVSGTAVVSGVSVTGCTQIDATTYHVTVGGAGLANTNGTLSLGFAGGQNIADTAATPNALTATTPTGANESYTLDNTAPLLTSSSPADDATGVAVGANITLTFDSAIVAGTGSIVLKRADGTTIETFNVATGAGTAGGSLGFFGTSITINPGADLANSTGYYIQIASTAVTDGNGNAYAGISDATTLNFTSIAAADTTPPTIAITSDKSALKAGETATLTFTLSESASDFVVGDITVSGGTLSNFSGSGTTYTATFTPTADSTANGVISVASAKFTDAAGNANADGADANNTVTITVDSVRPTIAITSDKSALKAGETATLTFTLSESASDFVVGDITVSGGTLSNFSGSGTTYTATFTPTADSTANGVISVASAKFTDAAGNANADGADANNTVTITVDSVVPVITFPGGSAGAATAAKTIDENTTAVATLSASETVTWTLVGGTDQAKFTINASTGALSFL